MKNISIRVKLLALIVIILVPLTLLHYTQIKKELNNSIESELNASEDFAKVISLSFIKYIDEIWGCQKAIGLSIVSNPNWRPDYIEKYMNENLSKGDHVLTYSWVGVDGTVIGSTRPSLRGRNISERDYFCKIIGGEEKVISNLKKSYLNEEPIVLVARGIKVDGKLKGVIVSLLDVEELNNIFLIQRTGKTSKYGLVDNSGMMVYFNGMNSIPFDKRKIKEDSSIWGALKGNVVKKLPYHSKCNGKELMGIGYPIKSIGWACFVATSVDELLGKHIIQMRKEIFILFFVYLSSFILAMLLGNKLIKPINKIKEVAEEVSKGNLNVRTNCKGTDELAATSQAFDRMTEGINQRLIESEEYNRLKSQFLATISHELKTPLNIILGAVQLIERLDLNDRESFYKSIFKYIKMMKQNSFRLLKLINNIVDINRIEGNHFTIKFVNGDIVKTVEDITLSVVEYTKLKNINLVFDTEIEEKMMAFDPDKIERIMLNLLSNAIKFTESNGCIEINLYDRNENVIISIKDDGIGIPENMLEKIFERFTQVDSSLRRKAEGSGIGLSLVKSLVEMHKGSIKVKSECNKGSEFIIELPVFLTDSKDTSYEGSSMSNIERANIEFSDIYY